MCYFRSIDTRVLLQSLLVLPHFLYLSIVLLLMSACNFLTESITKACTVDIIIAATEPAMIDLNSQRRRRKRANWAALLDAHHPDTPMTCLPNCTSTMMIMRTPTPIPAISIWIRHNILSLLLTTPLCSCLGNTVKNHK